jgi:hypothetical protein
VGVLASVRQLPFHFEELDQRSSPPAGPQLALCLARGFDELSDAELLEVAAAARRQTSWAQARELAAIAELSRRRAQAEEDGEPDHRFLSAHESVCQEVSAALTVTGETAATLVHLADRLADELPDTRRALETGHIDFAKARVISELSDGLPADLTESVEARVLPSAHMHTTGQLRRRIRRIVQRLAPEHLERRKREAVRDRRLEVWDAPSGTSDLALTGLDPVEAHTIFNKITAAARGLKADGDTRTLHQIRADLAQRLLHGANLPEAVRAAVTTTPAIAQSAPEPPSATPSDEVTATLAEMTERELTAIRDHLRATGRTDALPIRINRAVQSLHDRLGDLREARCRATDHVHTGYRPSAATRRAVEGRHATCVFPSCNRRSDRCDLDHTIPWGRGATCPCNLAPLCRRHHRTKQTPGWTLSQPWPGLLIWTTPSGTWHITLPSRE